MAVESITLSCKLGNFTFDGNVDISKAKLIRDEVMGQFFNPSRDLPRLLTEEDIDRFVRNEPHLNRVSDIPFEVTIHRNGKGVRING